MKTLAAALTTALLSSAIMVAQTNPNTEAFAFGVGGTFAKPKICKKATGLAILQYNVDFKQATTKQVTATSKKFTGIGRSNAASATGQVTAYLETTDGELTSTDFQMIADYGYDYFQKAIKKAGLDTAAWTAIVNTDIYKKGAEEEEDDRAQDQNKGQWWTRVSAHHGNTIFKRNQIGGFAFGKGKKAAKGSEELKGAGCYFNITVDFADINIAMDVRPNSAYKPSHYKMKSETEVSPLMKVAANGGLSLLYNEKNVTESLSITKDIDAEMEYADGYSEDPSRANNRSKLFSVSFSTKLESTPVVIYTTKAKYSAAAKKALEQFADAFVAKTLLEKKGKD